MGRSAVERDRERIRPMHAPKVLRFRQRERRMRASYEHPDLGDDPQFDRFEAADKDLARKCEEFLARHYLIHHFCVDISTARGYMKVYIPELMGTTNGWIIHVNRITCHNDFEKIMHRACGEILERYKIPRAGFMEWELAAALARLPAAGVQNAPVPE